MLGFGPISSLPLSDRPKSIQISGLFGTGVATPLISEKDIQAIAVQAVGMVGGIQKSLSINLTNSVFGTGIVNNLIPVSKVGSTFGTGIVAPLSTEIKITKFLPSVFGTGIANNLQAFQSSASILGVHGTGIIQSLVSDILLSKVLLGVHGTGVSSSLAPVSIINGVHGTGLTNHITIADRVAPLGVFGTGLVHVLFIQAQADQFVREILNNSIGSATIDQLVRESLLTDQSGPATVGIDQIIREILSLNNEATIQSDQIIREILTVNNNSYTEIKIDQIVREILTINSNTQTTIKIDQTIREILFTDTNKQIPSIILVVS